MGFRTFVLDSRFAVNTMGGGCCRREALGISTLDFESSDRGSNPREVLCTPARFDELRSVVRAVGVVLLGLGLFAVVGFSAGLCVLDIRLVCGGVRTAGGTLRFPRAPLPAPVLTGPCAA